MEGLLIYETKKIRSVILKTEHGGVPLALIGGAGNAAILKQSFEIIEEFLKKNALERWNCDTPTAEQFKMAVRDLERIFTVQYKEFRDLGIVPDAQVLLSSVDVNGEVSIYLIWPNGLAEPIHDSPGFAIIGSGELTGGLLLLRLLLQSTIKDPNCIGILAAFIVNLVSEVNATVGSFTGDAYFMYSSGNKVHISELTQRAAMEFLKISDIRKEILRMIWALCDTIYYWHEIKELDFDEQRLRDILEKITRIRRPEKLAQILDNVDKLLDSNGKEEINDK